jgi:cytoskeletal protein RodZ
MAEALDGLKHRLGYISDQHVSAPPISEPVRAARVVVEKPRSSSRRYLWLIPAALAVVVVGALGIFGVVAVLFRASPVANSNSASPVVAVPTPTATPRVESVAATPAPTVTTIPTPETVYVEPTPEPTPKPQDRVNTDSGQRDNIRKTTAQAVPTRTPIHTDPRPAPTRKPKPAQDPNCVFTNSCH